jgi:glycosyltransferase involved in cell wall biosynthesis
MEFDAWSYQTEVRSLMDIDVGIMPLRDDERSLGRCGYKAIQYMAVGLPVVTTPVGAATEIVEDGRNGFHATTCEDWYRQLTILAKNAKLRQSMGKQNRNKVEENFSVQKNVYRLLDIFQQRMST